MNQQAIKDALDKAIVVVAEEEFQRLSSGLPLHEIADRVDCALKELEKLQWGEIPKYKDEWVALCYLTWYQPSHINLAYSIIKASGVRLKDRLHIVDFGCGALAMQFAVALSVADALDDSQSFNRVRVDSIDTSKPMISIGKKLWKQFKAELVKNPNSQTLQLACDMVKPRVNKTIRPWGDHCWISAIHAIYNKNLTDVHDALNDHVSDLMPSMWFTTTQFSNRALLRTIWPENDGIYKQQHKSNANVIPRFNGSCEATSRWRRNLRNQISVVPCVIKKKNGYPIREFLNGVVSWKWPKVAILQYDRL